MFLRGAPLFNRGGGGDWQIVATLETGVEVLSFLQRNRGGNVAK